MTPADWEQHVANNHIPFRRDCAVCVHGSGTGRRHVGVAHPDVYCIPRLKGVKEEPDPTTAEGFEDPALLPGGTHRGVRTTTREANAPQQNGTAEQAIRWLGSCSYSPPPGESRV